MRLIQNFNQNWLFTPHKVDENVPDSDFTGITIPHSNKTFTQRYVNNADYQFISTYRKYFTVPEDRTGKRVFLQFDGVMLESTVYLNGEKCATHQGGYTPFTVDITGIVTDGDNLLTVFVDATEHKHIPPYGNLVDYLTFGGIYRDVFLLIVDETHIKEVIATPADVLENPRLDCTVKLSNAQSGLSVEAQLLDAEGNIVARHKGTVNRESLDFALPDLDIHLWTLNDPLLYQFEVKLLQNGTVIDNYSAKIGFREAEFSTDGAFYLNGEKLKLFGVNRHQTYPFIGAAAPKRLQEMDADIIKHELGCNIVRTSHYAQSPHFLNRCDEIGLLVFEELAGWQHIGDETWKQLVYDDLEAMIKRDRHHASIILWGVRVNESPDDEAFYTKTNAMAHELDPSRQTGGVRNFIESQQLEDVFTLNDFLEIIQTPRPPHLITEFSGHMFPTKTNDHEARRVEHALKHARKHNLQYGHDKVAGAISWCAFDYHTHKEFGSGDRICHHGVMDMFRLPKYAAYFYRSQKAVDDEIVLFAATGWTMGDRDGGGNNPLVIFSNCERVEILIGEESMAICEPDYETYPHLPHPPFVLKWEQPYNPWGTGFEDLIVRGYIGDKVVAEHCVDSDHIPHEVCLQSSSTELHADGSDMARLSVSIVDKYGNVLPYRTEVVTWSIKGNAELIGEDPMALIGGQGACFVRAGHETGTISVMASVLMLKPVTIDIDIVG